MVGRETVLTLPESYEKRDGHTGLWLVTRYLTLLENASHAFEFGYVGAAGQCRVVHVIGLRKLSMCDVIMVSAFLKCQMQDD